MDFKHTSIKQSALGWVKKSIDDNLATIRSDLNIYVEEKDASVLASVQAKLGDIQGVLTMIEQYGAAMRFCSGLFCNYPIIWNISRRARKTFLSLYYLS